jgi:hypothetical protein
MLIFVVARDRPDRYEQLRRHFGNREGARIVLDRRNGERRASLGEERRRFDDDTHLEFGWSVIVEQQRADLGPQSLN